MLNPRIRAAIVVLAASAGLGACTSLGPYGGIGVGVGNQYGYGGYGDDYGYGYGSPYSPYGYGYGSPYYGGYPYFGWHDGYYYPGSGYWVYDPDGDPHPITDDQRGFWQSKLAKFREARGVQASAAIKQDWTGFSREGRVTVDAIAAARSSAQAEQRLSRIGEARRQVQAERRQVSAESAQATAERAQARAERAQVRAERQEARRQETQERSEARPSRRRPQN